MRDYELTHLVALSCELTVKATGTRDELNEVTKYQAFCNEMRSDGLSGL